MDSSAVLDSSAILAAIYSEPGSDQISALPRGALLSSVNLVEVQSKLILDGSTPIFAWSRIFELGCEVCAFDGAQARIASEMIRQTKPFGLSLGDRACLALAIERRAIVYTADQVWRNLSLGVQIEIIR